MTATEVQNFTGNQNELYFKINLRLYSTSALYIGQVPKGSDEKVTPSPVGCSKSECPL